MMINVRNTARPFSFWFSRTARIIPAGNTKSREPNTYHKELMILPTAFPKFLQCQILCVIEAPPECRHNGQEGDGHGQKQQRGDEQQRYGCLLLSPFTWVQQDGFSFFQSISSFLVTAMHSFSSNNHSLFVPSPRCRPSDISSSYAPSQDATRLFVRHITDNPYPPRQKSSGFPSH